MKMVVMEKTEIPARTTKGVRVRHGISKAGTYVIEPAVGLLRSALISRGRVLLNVTTETSVVPITNLATKTQYLMENTTVGKLHGIEDGPVKEVQEERSEVPNDLTEEMFESNMNSELTDGQRQQLRELLRGNEEGFAKTSMELGCCKVTQHTINVNGAKPIHQRARPNAWKERELIQEQVEKMKRQGVVEDSDSPWSSPVVLVKKKTGEWRFCVDYRKLNEVTVKDVYSLPKIDETLARLEGSKYFSIMDLQSGYHQIPLHPEDRQKTAFITADVLYQFKVLPFGLRNAPSTFQKTMEVVLAGLKWTACLIYIDDAVVFAPTFEEHLLRLDQVLSCLRKANFKLKLSKCRFGETKLKVLGHVVDATGIAPDPEKLQAVTDIPSPGLGQSKKKRVKAIQSFLGLCSYYRRHIENFAKIARPVTDMLKEETGARWGEAQEEAFRKLKAALQKAPVFPSSKELLTERDFRVEQHLPGIYIQIV